MKAAGVAVALLACVQAWQSQHPMTRSLVQQRGLTFRHTPFLPSARQSTIRQSSESDGAEPGASGTATEKEVASAPVDTPAPKFDLKADLDSSGAGFNQFDPVLSASGFLSRRFGIFGGLGIVALLAATEGSEILKAVTSGGPVVGTGEVVTLASGVQYEDLLIASAGDAAGPGFVIGFDVKVSIGDSVLYDTSKPGEKPVAFKYGQRPFQNVVCEGLEEGIVGMKVGGKRRISVPESKAPPGPSCRLSLQLPCNQPRPI